MSKKEINKTVLSLLSGLYDYKPSVRDSPTDVQKHIRWVIQQIVKELGVENEFENMQGENRMWWWIGEKVKK